MRNNFSELKLNDGVSSLLNAALESMSDGFTIWDENLNLIAFNQHYKDIFYNKADDLKIGMSLRDLCELSVVSGNYKDIRTEELFLKFSSILNASSKLNETQVFEREIKGLKIRSTFIYAKDVGYIVTHKDISVELQQKKLNKKQKKQLITQNIWFNTAINSMHQGLCLFGADKRLIICNKAYAHLYELPKKLIKPGTLFDDILDYRLKNGLVSEGETKENFLSKRLVMVNEAPKIQEFVETINGRKIDVIRKRMKNGGWVATQQDITEQRQKEELIEHRSSQLLQENMRFNVAVNNMSHALSQFDKDLNLVICNQPYIDLYELPEHLAQPGTNFWDILDHDAKFNRVSIADKDQRLKIIGEVFKNNKATNDAITMLNGQIIFINLQPMEDGGWLTIHEDITEQHQKEKLIEHRSNELLQQNMRFDAAVNNMLHGLAMFDTNQNLVICNEPYKRLYKLPVSLTKPGTNFWDILEHGAKSGMVSIESPAERFEALTEIIEGSEPFKGPVHMVNGQTLFVQHQPLQDGGWLSTHEDITEKHKSEELIRYLAHHDELTGIANRSHFMQKLEERIKKTSCSKNFGVLSIDLDNFKPINDNFGHEAGDAVIKEMGRRISLHISSGAIAARLGGDEFAVLIDKVKDKYEIEEVAKKIIQKIQNPIEWDGIELNISVSIGIAISSNNITDTQTIMRNSDLALYYAKKEDGASYCFFEKIMDEKRKKRQTIEEGLKKALKDGGLRLHFQPLVSLENNKISCCEALMRWENETQSFSPFEFIPVAEKTGLIREMGKWAIQTACLTAVKWPNEERVAVNISPVQFTNNDLVNQVADALIISGLDANRLELEITESLFLADSEQNLKILHDLKSLGVRIALDDFGTGYSSLSYILSFPFDKIKIDRSFIYSLSKKKENISLIKAVVDIGKSMGMTTTAEGIETQEQLDAVREQGCNEIQGYLFSPPLPEKAINEMLKVPKENLKRKFA